MVNNKSVQLPLVSTITISAEMVVVDTLWQFHTLIVMNSWYGVLLSPATAVLMKPLSPILFVFRPPRFLVASVNIERKTELEREIQVQAMWTDTGC